MTTPSHQIIENHHMWDNTTKKHRTTESFLVTIQVFDPASKRSFNWIDLFNANFITANTIKPFPIKL